VGQLAEKALAALLRTLDHQARGGCPPARCGRHSALAPQELREVVQQTASEAASIMRVGAQLEAGLAILAELRAAGVRALPRREAGAREAGADSSVATAGVGAFPCREGSLDPSASTAEALETLNLLDTAEMVLSAALMRDESRGPHLRFRSFAEVVPLPRRSPEWDRYIVIKRAADRLLLTPRPPTPLPF